MEFNVERGTFQEGVQKTLGIVERKTTMPILNNILIRAGDNSVTIIATDREIGLVARYDANVTIPGEITVAARKLHEMIRETQDDTINFKKLENNWVTITCGKVVYRLPGLAAEEFPEVSDEADMAFSRIRCDVLREMINKTFFAISTDEMRVSLNGVYFRQDNGSVVMVATDGHRLSIAKKPTEGETLSDIDGIIIPRKGVGEIRKLVEDGSEHVEVGIGQGVCVVKKNDTVLRVSLIDAEYPDYHKVIPEQQGVEVSLNKDQILHSLRRMSVISSERFSGVKITLEADKMILTSTNPDIGEARDEIDISYSGKEFEMGYNVKYLIDAIDVIADKEISLEMREAHGPSVIREIGSEGYMCIIMPLRL